MPDRKARVDPEAGRVELRFVVGDGVVGDWSARLVGAPNRSWSGNTDDALPDAVSLPAAGLDGTSIAWVVVLYGPAAATPYHVRVRCLQGGRERLDRPLRLSGTLQPRAAKVLSGTVTFEET